MRNVGPCKYSRPWVNHCCFYSPRTCYKSLLLPIRSSCYFTSFEQVRKRIKIKIWYSKSQIESCRKMLCLTYRPGQALLVIPFLLCSTNFLPTLQFYTPQKIENQSFPDVFSGCSKWSTGSINWVKVAHEDYKKLAFADWFFLI